MFLWHSFQTFFPLFFFLSLVHCRQCFNERSLIRFSTGQPAQRLQLCGGNSAGELDSLSLSLWYTHYVWSPAWRRFAHNGTSLSWESDFAFKEKPHYITTDGLIVPECTFKNLLLKAWGQLKETWGFSNCCINVIKVEPTQCFILTSVMLIASLNSTQNHFISFQLDLIVLFLYSVLLVRSKLYVYKYLIHNRCLHQCIILYAIHLK